jgi:NAD(P)-dependent dehydrogenase (short-subunit alcohol dehydrogenase family)
MTKLSDLSPKRAALVTGGARRVGRAIVEDLALNGWRVAIHYRASGREAQRLAHQVNNAGGMAVIVEGDLNDIDALPGIVECASRKLGPLTLLVNNASIYEKDAIGSLDKARWLRQFSVNLGAPVFLAQAFAAQVPSTAEGNIINLLDARVLRPTSDFFSYQLSKSALLTATQIMAQALAPRIRVNGIAPGPVLPSAHSTEDRFGKRIAKLPLERAPELREFGRTIRYFIENRSMTGQIVALDGGQSVA